MALAGVVGPAPRIRACRCLVRPLRIGHVAFDADFVRGAFTVCEDHVKPSNDPMELLLINFQLCQRVTTFVNLRFQGASCANVKKMSSGCWHGKQHKRSPPHTEIAAETLEQHRGNVVAGSFFRNAEPGPRIREISQVMKPVLLFSWVYLCLCYLLSSSFLGYHGTLAQKQFLQAHKLSP